MIDKVEGKEGFDENDVITLYRAKLFFEWGEGAEESAIEFDLEVNGDIEDKAEFIVDLIEAYGGIAEVEEEGHIINLNGYKYATVEKVSEMSDPSHKGMVLH